MNILLCNDDGILAPGIRVLLRAVRPLGEITIIAPTEERSAVGHAITVFDPIKVQEIELGDAPKAYAVGGTPADCVKIAVRELMPEPPDIVFSGINLGTNTGINIIYSGTVSAATEAAILGIPSVAISLTTYTNPRWETAEKVAAHIARRAAQHEIPENSLLNVNIPNVPPDQLKGYKIARIATSRWFETFHRRSDPRGNAYYWLDGEMKVLGSPEGTDVDAVREGYVAVTPIGLDLTRYDLLEDLAGWKFGIEDS